MDKIEKGLGLTPHRSVTKVTPVELLSEDNSLGLPLGLEAPCMTPNSVFFFLLTAKWLALFDMCQH